MSSPPSKSTKIGYAVAIAFSVIFVLVAFSKFAGTPNPTINFTPSTQTATASPVAAGTVSGASLGAETPASTTGRTGDQLSLNGLSVLVGRIWATDQPSPILGDRTCADIAFRNQSGTPVDISMFDWKLTTPQGLTLDATIGGESLMLPFATVEQGGAATGSVCFATKFANAGTWTLKYKPSIWSNDQLTWTNQ